MLLVLLKYNVWNTLWFTHFKYIRGFHYPVYQHEVREHKQNELNATIVCGKGRLTRVYLHRY